MQITSNPEQGCVGESFLLSNPDIETFSVIDQDYSAPVTIAGTQYQNSNPLNVSRDPVTPLAYDKTQFYIDGEARYSVASGTFEMYQQDDSSNFYVRLGDEEFQMQSPIDVHLIRLEE